MSLFFYTMYVSSPGQTDYICQLWP